MVVNYREKPVGPILFFLLFVLVCLIGMPLWALRHFGTPQGPFAGKLILAPILGVLYLIVAARTFRFNTRVRRDPRALQWDTLGLNLWQGGRAERLAWPQVTQVSVEHGKRASDLSFLKIVTSGPGGARRWSFPSGRLQLSGQSLPTIASQIEQARSGSSVVSPDAPVDPEAAADREERVAAARGIVAIVTCVYFVTPVGMIIYLSSSRTMLLTPHDPLLWRSAKIAFLGTAGAILLWYLKTIWSFSPKSWRVALSFLRRVMVPGLTFAAMMGLWAYLAANIYVTDKTWGGHVEHSRVLMVVMEPMITHHGRPNVEAHLLDRPGQDVFFTIDEAHAELLRRWHDPGYIDEPACLTVPIQWAGYAIRSEVTTDTPLPNGSLSTCSWRPVENTSARAWHG